MIDNIDGYSTSDFARKVPTIIGFVLFAGTMQASTANTAFAFVPSYTQASPSQTVDDNTPHYVNQLNTVQEMYEFKKHELASKFFNTTRQQLNNWFNGGNAKLKPNAQQTLDRLLTLGNMLSKQQRLELSGTLFRKVGPDKVLIADAIMDPAVPIELVCEWLSAPAIPRTTVTENRKRALSPSLGSRFG